MKQLLFLITFTLLLFSCNQNCPDQKKIIHDTIVVIKRDSIIVHDTIYTSKHYDHVETLNQY